MTITVYMDEAGAVWITSGQGDILAECFFKTEDETEDELRLMGYERLLTVYPTAHLAAGTGLDPAELGELFLEVCQPHGQSPTAGPQRADTPYASREGLPPPPSEGGGTEAPGALTPPEPGCTSVSRRAG